MPTEYSGSGDPQRTIDLLWGVHRRRRGPKPSLSGEQVVTTANQIADRDGLGGLSMRRLADELGITAMSLYGYVPSKAELLDVMADRAYGEIAVPRDPATSWRAPLAALAEQHWTLLLSHPWLLQIAASPPLLGPNLTAFYDAELAAVDGLGLTDIDMDLVVSLLDDYVRGAARARRGRRSPGPHRHLRPAVVADLRPSARRSPRPGPLPHRGPRRAAAGAEYGAAHDPAHSFRFGLQRIIDGIAIFVGHASR